MSIKKITIGAGYAGYLNSSVEASAMAVSDLEGAAHYYTAPGTPAGVWMGKGATLMGREAGESATAEQTSMMLDQLRNPKDGGQLLTIPERNSKRAGAARRPDTVSGWDLTFAAPKSASVLWALGDEETRKQVQLAHTQAVAESLAWFEDTLASTRQGKNGVMRTKVAGVSAIRFDHWDNRDGEPHLHSHLTVSNAVERADGNIGALDGRVVYAWGVAMGKRYNQILMDRLHQNLGVDWVMRSESVLGTTSTVWDIEGLDLDLIQGFSQRTAATNRKLAELVAAERAQGREPDHAAMARLKEKAWAATRKPKEHDPKPLNLKRADWAEQARWMGHDPLAETRGVEGREAGGVNQRTVTADNVLDALSTMTATDLDAGEKARRQQALSMVEAGAEAGRTTISRANIDSAALDLLAGVRFSSTSDLDASVERIRESVAARLIPLQENRYQVPDSIAKEAEAGLHGVSTLDEDPMTAKYATKRLMDAEETFMGIAADRTEALEPEERKHLAKALDRYSLHVASHPLDPDQRKAALALLTSQSRATGLVGAAGTGKTTTLKALLHTGEETGLTGQVLGISPSARGAEELESSLERPTTTVAAIITEAHVGAARGKTARLAERIEHEKNPEERKRLHALYATALIDLERLTVPQAGTVIVDEASMISTLDAAELAAMCKERNARLIMVGDPEQVGSPGVGGGSLAWLERAGLSTEITTTHRFDDPHEAKVAAMVRKGATGEEGATYTAIDEYEAMGRITSGPDVKERIFQDTIADLIGGVDATIAAASVSAATELNQRIGAELQARGLVDADPARRLPLADGTSAGKGDLITTRRIDKNLVASDATHVRNGDQWRVETVTGRRLTASRIGDGARVEIPAEWLELNASGGYASTLIRTQGRTSTVSRQLIPLGSAPNRGSFYVGVTRGRRLNQIYVETPDLDALKRGGSGDSTLATWRSWKREQYEEMGRIEWTHQGPAPDPLHYYTDSDLDPTSLDLAKETLNSVMGNRSDTRMAHEVRDDHRSASHSITRLTAERDAIGRARNAPELRRLLGERFDAEYVEGITGSEQWDRLVSTWSRARSLDPAGAELLVSTRVRADTAMLAEPGMLFNLNARPDPATSLIEGLTDLSATALRHPKPASAQPGASDREQGWDALLEQNQQLLDEALDRLASSQRAQPTLPWVKKLGAPAPRGTEEGKRWDRLLKDIALYRAHHHETRLTDPLGPMSGNRTPAGRLRNAERVRLLDRIRNTRTPATEAPGGPSVRWSPTVLDRAAYARLTRINEAAWKQIRSGKHLSEWATTLDAAGQRDLLAAGLVTQADGRLIDRHEPGTLVAARDVRNRIVALVPADGTDQVTSSIWEPEEMVYGLDRAASNLAQAGLPIAMAPDPETVDRMNRDPAIRTARVAVTKPGSHQLDLLRHLQQGRIRQPLILGSEPVYLRSMWNSLNREERAAARVCDEKGRPAQALWQAMAIDAARQESGSMSPAERVESLVITRLPGWNQDEARQWARQRLDLASAQRVEADTSDPRPLRELMAQAEKELEIGTGRDRERTSVAGI